MLRSRGSRAGFTIVELVVIISITSILSLAFFSAAYSYFELIYKNNALIDMTVSSQTLLRSTVESLRLGDGVRQSSSITDPNAPADGWDTSNDDFVIVIAVPAINAARDYIIDPSTGSPYMNELVYYKNAATLMQRSLAHPDAAGNSLKTSCPPEEAVSDCPADKELAEYVDSVSFTLYDQDDGLTTEPLQARSVKIDLVMKRKILGYEISLDNSVRATLRNLFQAQTGG
ncbi:MAG: prepilin-type N-terminal cleavage/methylation domain-containing protein [Candidatus Saccharimonadales bacterium]